MAVAAIFTAGTSPDAVWATVLLAVLLQAQSHPVSRRLAWLHVLAEHVWRLLRFSG